MRKTYFFSDAHLGMGTRADDREKESCIVRFLDHISLDAEQLFIVGDLFDYWFEYRTVVPKGYVRLFAALARLADAGVAITYVAGNHDFWVRSYFRDELGMEIALDPIEREIHGKRFYIHHGDGLLTGDSGYRFLKRVLRNRFNIFLFSLLHPDLAASIAQWTSRKSRQHTSQRTFEEGDMVSFAQTKIEEGFDVVVMGHNHIPGLRNIGSGVYVNLGEWMGENTFAVFDGKRVKLEKWQDVGSTGRKGLGRSRR
jgi:UDP-2,3-diacylglucosamine hydrolase